MKIYSVKLMIIFLSATISHKMQMQTNLLKTKTFHTVLEMTQLSRLYEILKSGSKQTRATKTCWDKETNNQANCRRSQKPCKGESRV